MQLLRDTMRVDRFQQNELVLPEMFEFIQITKRYLIRKGGEKYGARRLLRELQALRVGLLLRGQGRKGKSKFKVPRV